ncbi:hypothetical protein O3M35_011774 [Rhynocoris fuscipes]|uniref:Uncharacterized protein n=1 Tax=Rhynocoris fuscipes TaxID=488301 RepID=A0AAW1CXF4_9HEMI
MAFNDYCLRTPMITVIYYGMSTFVYMLCYTLFFKHENDFNTVDIVLVCIVLISAIPFQLFTYFGVAKRNMILLTIAITLYVCLVATYLFFIFIICTQKYKSEYKGTVKFNIVVMIAIFHCIVLPFPAISIIHTMGHVRSERITEFRPYGHRNYTVRMSMLPYRLR